MLVDLFLLRIIRSVDLCLSQFPSMGLPSQVSIRDHRPHLCSSFGIILRPKTKSYGLYLMSSNTAPSSSGGARSADSAAPRRSKRPKYSRFTQQELPACKPILTPNWVISAFMLVAIVFINIGVATLFASRDVVEIVDRYEADCIPASSRSVKVIYIQT
ncbi:ALA-interacting subunit 3-like [Rosa rugosa]|uniref:ALA-interacting subunit 3-like n=1 Tax=Rosa rugosa TaxID=74645 RepID=UPI002B402BC5|nr:ALA-interacting subunit 3-like [Rosa rugosa]XP_062011423.1 ALA-interacting subunit 3-like [Rosa rugosa]